MIISRVSLHANELCPAVDARIPALTSMELDSKGVIYSQNRDCFLAVSPVPRSVKDLLPLQETVEQDQCNYTFSSVEAKRVIKRMPKKSSYQGNTDFLDITKNVMAKMFDGIKDHFINFAKTLIASDEGNQLQIVPHKRIDRRFKGSYAQDLKGWVCVNKKRFKSLVDVLNKIIDSNDDMLPIMIHTDTQTGTVCIEGINPRTKQKIYGVIKGEPVKKRRTVFERSFFND